MPRYSQVFSLKDLFNNPALKNKLPFVNYKERELENGKISVRTGLKTVNRQVFDTATSAARPYYKPIKTIRSGNLMVIGGELVGDHDEAVDAVYNSLLAQTQLISFTANNANMIRDALKETEKNKRQYGIDSKLYLRAQSITEIQGMTQKQLGGLMQNIMENIVYGDNFPRTQAKYSVENFEIGSPYNYEQRKLRWKFKVGDL